MMQKKAQQPIMLQQYCEAALEKLDCLRKGGDSRVSGCTTLNYRVMLI